MSDLSHAATLVDVDNDCEGTSSVVLEAHGLAKSYREGASQKCIFSAIDLRVERGDMIAICGVSGSGKSSLLHLLGGLDRPSAGEVELMQTKLWQLSERERCLLRNQHLGFIYQFHHLLPEFNALENVMMPLLIRGQARAVAREQAEKLLIKVGLEQQLKQRSGELSGGERQRVAIARALVTKPACLLADEPTGNLDQQTAMQVFDLMLELNASLQTSIVMVTHNQQLARKMTQVWSLDKTGLSVS